MPQQAFQDPLIESLANWEQLTSNIERPTEGILFHNYLAHAKEALKELFSPVRNVQALFMFADRILELHRANPFTSLVIEEAGAHFIGLFLQRALHIPPDKVFALKPLHNELTPHSNFHEGLEAIVKDGGSRPIVVSEILRSGKTAALFVEELALRGVRPTYATLFYDSQVSTASRALLTNIRVGGVPALELLLYNVGTRTLTCKMPEAVELNAIPFPDGVRSFLPDCPNIAWLRVATSTEDRAAREHTIEFVEEALSSLLAVYNSQVA